MAPMLLCASCSHHRFDQAVKGCDEASSSGSSKDLLPRLEPPVASLSGGLERPSGASHRASLNSEYGYGEPRSSGKILVLRASRTLRLNSQAQGKAACELEGAP